MNHLLNSEYEDYNISYFTCNNDYWLPFSENEHDSFERTDGGYGYTRSDYGVHGSDGRFWYEFEQDNQNGCFRLF